MGLLKFWLMPGDVGRGSWSWARKLGSFEAAARPSGPLLSFQSLLRGCVPPESQFCSFPKPPEQPSLSLRAEIIAINLAGLYFTRTNVVDIIILHLIIHKESFTI